MGITILFLSILQSCKTKFLKKNTISFSIFLREMVISTLQLNIFKVVSQFFLLAILTRIYTILYKIHYGRYRYRRNKKINGPLFVWEFPLKNIWLCGLRQFTILNPTIHNTKMHNSCINYISFFACHYSCINYISFFACHKESTSH